MTDDFDAICFDRCINETPQETQIAQALVDELGIQPPGRLKVSCVKGTAIVLINRRRHTFDLQDPHCFEQIRRFVKESEE